MTRGESELAIPSVTETLRMQRDEQRDRAAGIETAASQRSARLIREQADRDRARGEERVMTSIHPEDFHDDKAWLATPPPAHLGPPICVVIREVAGWSDTRRADVRRRFQAMTETDTAAIDDAGRECGELLDEHPIGMPASCADEVTTIRPWVDAIWHEVCDGVAYVVQAVAAREHGLISPNDFDLLTGWWTAAGLPLPARTPHRSDRPPPAETEISMAESDAERRAADREAVRQAMENIHRREADQRKAESEATRRHLDKLARRRA